MSTSRDAAEAAAVSGGGDAVAAALADACDAATHDRAPALGAAACAAAASGDVLARAGEGKVALQREARDGRTNTESTQTSRSRAERIGRLKISGIAKHSAEIWGWKDED